MTLTEFYQQISRRLSHQFGKMGPIAVLGTGLEKILPDETVAAEAKIRLLELSQKSDLVEIEKAGDIIQAEVQSEHWLTATGRPLIMIMFGVIITNNYILQPYSLAIAPLP